MNRSINKNNVRRYAGIGFEGNGRGGYTAELLGRDYSVEKSGKEWVVASNGIGALVPTLTAAAQYINGSGLYEGSCKVCGATFWETEAGARSEDLCDRHLGRAS